MISSWGVMRKSDFRMGGHAEIGFLFSSAMTISRILKMYGNLSMTSLLVTHTGIPISNNYQGRNSITICFFQVIFKSRQIQLLKNQSEIRKFKNLEECKMQIQVFQLMKN